VPPAWASTNVPRSPPCSAITPIMDLSGIPTRYPGCSAAHRGT
jgi:hypothetical protein